MLPSRKSYSQSHLVEDVLNRSYNAHNSLADSKALKQLIQRLNPSNQLVAKHSFSIQEVANAMETRKNKLEKTETLEPLVVSDIVTKYMADKMAASGIDYRTLEDVYRTDRRDGIQDLLKGAGDSNNHHGNSSSSGGGGVVGVTKQSKSDRFSVRLLQEHSGIRIIIDIKRAVVVVDLYKIN